MCQRNLPLPSPLVPSRRRILVSASILILCRLEQPSVCPATWISIDWLVVDFDVNLER
jgi:hypothetical protein